MDRNAFGIMTPGAFKAAAFKKDRGPDAGPVFGGHALYFENSGSKIFVVGFVHYRYLTGAQGSKSVKVAAIVKFVGTEPFEA